MCGTALRGALGVLLSVVLFCLVPGVVLPPSSPAETPRAFAYPQVIPPEHIPRIEPTEDEFEPPPSDLESPKVAAEAAVLIDADTGAVLFEKNPREELYPASITKVLTAILAIENLKLDERVRVSQKASEVDGSRVYLTEGETASVRDLLYALILNSGNDAAIALAERVSGGIDEFSSLMNRRARQLGATGSNFKNPHGLHEPDHFTTAMDMALICRYAMENPVFREIAATKTFPWNGLEWQSVLINHNRLLWHYPFATGIKTGYTSASLHTLAASAEKEGHRLITVLLKGESAEQLRAEAIALFEYGFKEYETIPVAKKGNPLGKIEILGRRVDAVTAHDLFVTVPREYADSISRGISHRLELRPVLREVKKGEIIGSVVYYIAPKEFNGGSGAYNGADVDGAPGSSRKITVLGRVALVAGEEVKLTLVETLVGYVKRLFVGIGALAVVGWWMREFLFPLAGKARRSRRRSRGRDSARSRN